ncbi:MAG: SUMF1/EgtB/PvdO family nonheme iron enzyme [Bacteroidetes bacterium]|nr:SUMF1/EgtB/PvdO family nonheme iron enzyme [Bacteroidota bacterium]
MTDKLKIFVTNRKQEFDSLQPDANTWSKIESGLTKKNTHWIKSKWGSGLFYLGFSASVFVLLIYYFSQKPNQQNSNKNPDQINNTFVTKDTIQGNVKATNDALKNQNIIVQKNNINNSVLLAEATKVDINPVVDLPEYKETIIFKNTNVVTEIKDDSTYVFPKLTEKEIKANDKQKKRMLEQLLKLSKNKYPLVPKGKVNYKGEPKNVDEFYMKNVEVTNLEYRTFLFDLLIHDKKEEFLKAKPNQALWVNSNGSHIFDSFKEKYFSNKDFNDYAVVNISIEGAKLYCEWFSELIKSNNNSKNENKHLLSVRLPMESEWVFAAMGGFENAGYPWGKDSIQNSNNCFLANFCIQKSKDKFKKPFGYTTKINLNAYTSAGLATNNDTMAVAMVIAYNPNDYGLYCMSGNVSEWVISDDLKINKAIGGNWGSDFEHLKINSESEFNSKVTASPFIGFRPLVIMKK